MSLVIADGPIQSNRQEIGSDEIASSHSKVNRSRLENGPIGSVSPGSLCETGSKSAGQSSALSQPLQLESASEISAAYSKPLAIDLFTGLHGWAEGLVAEGWRVVGFDLEDMCAQLGVARPGDVQLVIQDVLTLHGRQFKNAALIVGSSPCQEFSYRAMPWKRAKALPPPYLGMELFAAQFRLQREAIEAAGHHIPLVVENVCGAQKWVGRARWHFGSFYLWGDVPALMPIARKAIKVPTMGAGWYPPGHPKHVPGLAFNGHADRNLRASEGQKNDGGSWFNVAHNTTSGHSRNPVNGGRKMATGDDVKQGGDWFNKASGNSISRRCSSRSTARKAASAHIAKIPYALSRHIARAWYPQHSEASA